MAALFGGTYPVVSATKAAPIPEVINFKKVHAASTLAGSSDVETNIAAFPPAGSLAGVPPFTPGIPGNGAVLSSKSALAAFTEPKLDVDQKNIPIVPALNAA